MFILLSSIYLAFSSTAQENQRIQESPFSHDERGAYIVVPIEAKKIIKVNSTTDIYPGSPVKPWKNPYVMGAEEVNFTEFQELAKKNSTLYIIGNTGIAIIVTDNDEIYRINLIDYVQKQLWNQGYYYETYLEVRDNRIVAVIPYSSFNGFPVIVAVMISIAIIGAAVTRES